MSENRVLYLVQWWTGTEWHIHEVYGGEPKRQYAMESYAKRVALDPDRKCRLVEQSPHDNFWVLYLHEPISQPAEDIWSDHVAQPPSRVLMDGEA